MILLWRGLDGGVRRELRIDGALHYGSPPSSAKGPELCRWSGLLLVICPSVCQFLLSGLEL
jgi:hypothetical protein